MLERTHPFGFRNPPLAAARPESELSESQSAARHPHFLAALLEGLAGWSEQELLSRPLRLEEAGLSQALESLPLYRRSELNRKLGAAVMAELVALERESDPDQFFQGLLQIARRLQSSGEAELSSTLILSLRRAAEGGEWNDLSAGLVQTLRSESDAIEGRGAVGQRFEFLLRHFAREVSHPATLASFAAGAAAFQGMRLFSLARLSAAPANFVTRAWRARGLAALSGVGAESVALTLTHRSLRQVLGERQHWDFASLRREFFANGITLGLMRGASSAAESAFLSLHGIQPAALQATRLSGFSGASRLLIPQTAMFGALLVANRTETWLGLRPETTGSIMLVDSFATLLQFHVGGRIFESLQPRGFAVWTRGLETHARSLNSVEPPRAPGLPDFPLQPRLVWAGAAGHESRSPRRIADDLMMMNERPKDVLEGVASTSPRLESVAAPNPVRHREVLDTFPHPVLVVDAHGEIRYANEHARRIFQPSLMDFANLRILEVFEPHPTEAGLFVWYRGENDVSYWRMESRPLEGEAGMTAHFFSDATELQRLREQSSALQEQNVRLAAKSQLAERFLHDGGNLLSDLSFREGMLERQLGTAGTAETVPGEPTRLTRFAGSVKELGSSLGKVMDFYRSWRRITAGGQRDIKVLSMEPLLNEALRLNEGARQRQQIELVTDFGPEALTIRGEESLLINAVLNLLVNACHAMPAGGRLSVRTYSREAFVVVEVSDNGSGIASEHLPHIFELGFTTKDHSGGTGLGLPNVKTAVENMHGGLVEVESQVGQGTTFRLFLPSSTAGSNYL